MAADKEMVVLKKTHLIVAIIAGMLTIAVSTLGANYASHGSLEAKINEARLETVKTFVPKEDFKSMSNKLDEMNGKLNRIEGYLSKGK